jgi:hypothetical protein
MMFFAKRSPAKQKQKNAISETPFLHARREGRKYRNEVEPGGGPSRVFEGNAPKKF